MVADRGLGHQHRALIVGPLTWDEFEDGSRRPGGAVAYAARVAEALDVRAAILTSAGPDANLAALAAHDVLRIGQTTSRFHHERRGDGRRLRVLARPDIALAAAQLPPSWRTIPLRIIAPLQPDDIDLASFAELAPADTAVLGQGLVRTIDDHGHVQHHDPLDYSQIRYLPLDCSLFLSGEETAGWPPSMFVSILKQTSRVVVTMGGEGATIHRRGPPGAPLLVPPAAADPVDTTGAGDVFASAFILALGLGLVDGDVAAARLAAGYAAAAVEQAGPAPLPRRAEIEARIRSAARPEELTS